MPITYTTKYMAKEKSKRSSDSVDEIISVISRARPKSAGAPEFEIARSTKNILSKIKYYIKTGIDSIDSATGLIPFNRLVEIFGMEASGKTALALKCAAMAQQRQIFKVMPDKSLQQIDDEYDITVMILDNEQTFADDEKIIVDGVRLDAAIGNCDTVFQMFKMIDLAMMQLQKRELRTGRTQLLVVIVDTIAGTSSEQELTKKWGDEDYSRMPKQLREGFRRLIRKVRRNNVCLICTNQVGDSFKKKFKKNVTSIVPDPEDFTSPGGKALKYYARLRMFIFNLRPHYPLVKGSQFTAGFMGGVKVIKNSQKMPSREARFVLLYDGGLNNDYSNLEQLCYLKRANNTETGGYTFDFDGIPLKTFDSRTESQSLETDDDEPLPDKKSKKLKKKPKSGEDDDEDSGSKKSSYKIEQRCHWPAYYKEHKEDFDALIEHANSQMFVIQGIDGKSGTETSLVDEDDAIHLSDEDIENA